MLKRSTFWHLLLVLSFPLLAPAQDWEPVLPFPVSDISSRQILDLYPDTLEDRLYIGGRFRNIGSDTFRNIVAYDGIHFYKVLDMNTCISAGCSGVFTIGRYRDEIVASLIYFEPQDGAPIVGVGSWNGEQWHPLGGGIALEYLNETQEYFPVTAYDFSIYDDNLYIAGYLPIIDSLPAQGVGAWDGTQWHTFNLFEGIPTDAILANSVAKYQGNLYLGDNIVLTVNGETLSDLIMYDGTAWQKVGDGLIDGLTNLHDVEVFQDKLYVAGYFAQSDGNPGNSIMSWDGDQWNDLGGGVCGLGIIDDLFVYKDKLYVCGLFDCISGIEAHNLAVWDGTKWCSIGHSTFNQPVNTIAVWRDTVYVGGGFYQINGQPVRHLARFVGDPSGSVCSEPISALEPVPDVSSDLSLYPNPVSNMLTINHSSFKGSIRYEVVDLSGRTQWSCADCPDLQEVLVADWPAGSYLVRAIGAYGVVVKGFVKR
ncbi:MAG: T9SS type A sorting domain-containing protein [Saprospiraceae bacterium]|nr:T9SS type A sorting domain-containing protein [Saprospiraceae bacterium]